MVAPPPRRHHRGQKLLCTGNTAARLTNWSGDGQDPPVTSIVMHPRSAEVGAPDALVKWVLLFALGAYVPLPLAAQSALSPDEIVRLAQAGDSCQYANDGECDEPKLCASGTDTTDCRNPPGLSGGFDASETAPVDLPGLGTLLASLLGGGLVAILLSFKFVVARAQANAPGVTLVPRSTLTSVARSQQIRDSIHDAFARTCSTEGIRAELFKSPPHESETWLRVEIDQPDSRPGYSSRATAVVMVTPREFFRFDPELVLAYTTNEGKTQKHDHIIEFGTESIRSLCLYLSGQATRFWIKPQRCRKWPLQLWRPRNRMEGIHELRWLTTLAASFRAFWWWATRDARGRMLSVSGGKPSEEPRRLIRLDSWQAVVREVAANAPAIRQDILRSLQSEAEAGSASGSDLAVGQRAWIADEDISYHGIDGRVERQQIVARLGRGIVFVHVYCYGKDLYVGWDAHVNAGVWAEKAVGVGVDPQSGRLTRALGVTTSWHSPNEYDVTDASFLLEWVHATVSRIIKDVVREYKIDQEINFEIVRERRQDVVGRADTGARTGGLLQRLRRTS
jgi:hypothetical protein